MIDLAILKGGGIDGGGTFVEYTHERRREHGWVVRADKELVTLQTFSGDYTVIHHVRPRALRRVVPESEG